MSRLVTIPQLTPATFAEIFGLEPIAPLPPPVLFDFDPEDLPDVYAMKGVEGRCMEPHIMDGTPLLFTRQEQPKPGDFVAIYRTRESTRPGEYQALVKELVSMDERVVLARMYNPPRVLFFHRRDVLAIHKCTGPRPESTQVFRMSNQEMARRKAARLTRDRDVLKGRKAGKAQVGT